MESRYRNSSIRLFRNQRMNALQEVIEIIKKGDLHGSFAGHRDGLDVQVNDLQYALGELTEEVASMKSSLQQLLDHFPALVETVDALLAKQNKPKLSKKKN
jgi:hypothetical protein